jgi:tRNA(fMet)-specific endonuclease VapC
MRYMFDTNFCVIRASLQRKGMLIGSMDLLIAAHARSRGLTIVTNNLREFVRVNGLSAEDWTECRL